ncbi:GlsB/YeaQ/YmgE family stress response membrane protein [Actibacterium sp.]|uniref:GlsB/YeaQ/YmgE family stress response membrane protein n=1 Tax=Actibacterium sp. TaxID=1872125 RepID=UPI000AA799FC|nr:GlsB/YeaQ/YmgE family stress response membrane protein [Actibacterium sp.]
MGVESMGIESIIAMLFVGAIAGWLAGLIVKGYGFGLLGNIAIGIVGAVVAGFLFPRIGLNLEGGIFDAIVHSTIGAVILLVLIKLVKKV